MPKQRSATAAGTTAEQGPDQKLASSRFDEIAAAHLGDPAITRTKMFGMPVLKVGGRVFAGVTDGRLVFKLPVARVEALLSAGHAERFQPMPGRAMKEWVTVRPDAAADWPELAAAARSFVAG
jgi:hypothetical protein